MASMLTQLQTKLAQASQYMAKHGGARYKQLLERYKQLLEQNKQYIQEPPTIEKGQTLANELFYTRLASIPGRYESFWKEVDYVKYLLKNRQEMKLENAGIGVLFGLECLAWFYGGEIVGRGFTLTGYHV